MWPIFSNQHSWTKFYCRPFWLLSSVFWCCISVNKSLKSLHPPATSVARRIAQRGAIVSRVRCIQVMARKGTFRKTSKTRLILRATLRGSRRSAVSITSWASLTSILDAQSTRSIANLYEVSSIACLTSTSTLGTQSPTPIEFHLEMSSKVRGWTSHVL